MGEVLGLTAAIPGLIQLANYGVTCAKMLYRYSNSAGSAMEEAQNCGNQARCFSIIAKLARSELQRHQAKYPGSNIIKVLTQGGVFLGIEDQSRSVQRRLRSVMERLSRQLQRYGRFELIRSLIWQFQKAEVLEILGEMESIKNSLTLAMVIARYENTEMELHETERRQHDTADPNSLVIISRLRQDMWVASSSIRCSFRLEASSEILGATYG
jgi:hypothetical protein